MGSYHSPTGLDDGKMVGRWWEDGGKYRTDFIYLDLLIYLFTYLFVWFNLPRKMIGEN